MNGARSVLCCVIVWLLTVGLKALPCSRGDIDESKRNGSHLVIDMDSTRSRRWLEPIHGLKVNYDNKELIIRYSPYNKRDNAVESRSKQKKKRPTIMQRIGRLMMMIPIGMQLLQLPMSIASLKMSLLKSILVAKVALFMLFLRTLFMSKPRDKIVIVRSPPKEYHEHYYHPFEDPEDNKPGWLGKAPAWLD